MRSRRLARATGKPVGDAGYDLFGRHAVRADLHAAHVHVHQAITDHPFARAMAVIAHNSDRRMIQRIDRRGRFMPFIRDGRCCNHRCGAADHARAERARTAREYIRVHRKKLP